jgi:hypothetical protein
MGLFMEVTECGVISENCEGASFQVNPPFLEGVNDGQHFLLMGSVVSFSRVHLP